MAAAPRRCSLPGASSRRRFPERLLVDVPRGRIDSLGGPPVRHVIGSLFDPWSMPDAAPRPAAAVDGELVAQAAGGDARAIGLLYDRYGAVLYAVAYRIVGQGADAAEVVVEAFAQAWRDAPRFEAGRGSVAGWLTTIARSRALDLVRARSRRERITASAAADRPNASPAMGETRPDPAGALDH